MKGIEGDEHIDHTYPSSKLNPNVLHDKLIGTNVVHLSPMKPADNIAKGNKILPELLLNQNSFANTFIATADLSHDERLKFRFLCEMYTAYIRFKLDIE